eukprot:CAMPEP_0194389534 /NCGR_PEP_ID=MMETSP0174-20130528/104628_1 /TAXON_ID=216777 /ORGANISM="Proboscia alata, Strain PI-D3" /LENGTH=151 /DNA_ID=CAMNT_0039181875 /DNA_START=79 /DNA_END=530 /DNA_ORIENTATION=+
MNRANLYGLSAIPSMFFINEMVHVCTHDGDDFEFYSDPSPLTVQSNGLPSTILESLAMLSQNVNQYLCFGYDVFDGVLVLNIVAFIIAYHVGIGVPRSYCMRSLDDKTGGYTLDLARQLNAQFVREIDERRRVINLHEKANRQQERHMEST